MNTTIEYIDDEAQPHQREPSVGSYIYSIGIFFGALIILIAISYSYYYIIARLKPTDDNSRNTPPIRSHHHHHRRQRSNRSPMSITSSDYDSESEITSHGLDEATINNRYPMLLFSELVVSHKSGYCGGGGGGGSGCSICLQDYEGKDSVRLLPECGHFFHAQCVGAWLRIHPNCPICRNSLIGTPPVDNPPAAAVAAAMSVQ